eukprot:5985979-Pyramimonas_sp.AAC.1
MNSGIESEIHSQIYSGIDRGIECNRSSVVNPPPLTALQPPWPARSVSRPQRPLLPQLCGPSKPDARA